MIHAVTFNKNLIARGLTSPTEATSTRARRSCAMNGKRLALFSQILLTGHFRPPFNYLIYVFHCALFKSQCMILAKVWLSC